MNLVIANKALAPFSFILTDYATRYISHGILVGTYAMFTDEKVDDMEAFVARVVDAEALPSLGDDAGLVSVTPISDGQGTVVVAVTVSSCP